MFFVKAVCLLPSIIALSATAQNSVSSKLPKLSTKQDVNNLRFLERKGKYTYYQRRSGSLMFATNFQVHEVIKGEVGTNYTITSSRTRKVLAVSANPNQFTFFDVVPSSDIYTVDYGKSEAKLLGRGYGPKLHLDDTWMSFYTKGERKLHFINAANPVLKFAIELPIKPNPYFSPTAVMLNEKDILYVDQNEKGIQGLLRLDRNTNQTKVIHKLDTPFQRLEICHSDKALFLGIFDLHAHNRGSAILTSSKSPINFRPLYTSEASDTGNIICDLGDDNIYFIKTLEDATSELVRLSPPASISVLSDLKHVSQVINMDGKLMIPFRGDFFLPMDKSGDYIGIENLTNIKKSISNPDPPKEQQ